MAVEEDIASILQQLTAAGSDPAAIIAALTASFTQGVQSDQAESKTAYQEAIEAIQSYYDQAEQDRGAAYNDQIGELASNAQNLGVDFMDSDLARSWDADQRYLTEAADTALATDLSWFEKMQSAQNDMYNAMLIEMAAQVALGGNAGATGGGGSGGRSGGGRSSGGGGGSDDEVINDGTAPLVGETTHTVDADTQTYFNFPEFIPYMEAALEKGYITPSQYNTYNEIIDNADEPKDALRESRSRLNDIAEGRLEHERQMQLNPRPTVDLDNVINGVMPNMSRIADYGRRGLNYANLLASNNVYEQEWQQTEDELAPFINILREFDPIRGPVKTYERLNESDTWKAKQEDIVDPRPPYTPGEVEDLTGGFNPPASDESNLAQFLRSEFTRINREPAQPQPVDNQDGWVTDLQRNNYRPPANDPFYDYSAGNEAIVGPKSPARNAYRSPKDILARETWADMGLTSPFPAAISDNRGAPVVAPVKREEPAEENRFATLRDIARRRLWEQTVAESQKPAEPVRQFSVPKARPVRKPTTPKQAKTGNTRTMNRAV